MLHDTNVTNNDTQQADWHQVTQKSPQQWHAGEPTLSNLNIKTNHQGRCKQVQQSIHSSWVGKIPVITSTSWHRPANHLGVIVLMFTVHHMLGFATCHLLGEVDQFPWKPISTTQSIIVNNIDGSGSLHTPLEYILTTLPVTIQERLTNWKSHAEGRESENAVYKLQIKYTLTLQAMAVKETLDWISEETKWRGA